MITLNQQIDRLFTEWKTHGKIAIAIDIDDTIMTYRIATQSDCDEIIEILKDAKRVGAYLVIHTACNSDRYEEIVNYCTAKELPIDAINETVIDVPFGKLGSKIYANIFIDDRAGLNEALEILNDLKNRSSNGFFNAAEIALIYVGLADLDQAMNWLETSYKERFNPSLVMRPCFDPLRSDPRFQALLGRIGLKTRG